MHLLDSLKIATKLFILIAFAIVALAVVIVLAFVNLSASNKALAFNKEIDAHLKTPISSDYSSQMRDVSDSVSRKLGQLSSLISKTADAGFIEQRNRSDGAMVDFIYIAVGILGLLIVLGVLITRSITLPLAKVIAISNKMASGDLLEEVDERMAERHDEG